MNYPSLHQIVGEKQKEPNIELDNSYPFIRELCAFSPFIWFRLV